MLKAISILMSLILLAQGLVVNFAELVKMDALLEHVKYHQEQYGDDLTTFINKHYGDQKDQHFKDHQEEQNDHERLPYHITVPFINQAICHFDQAMVRFTIAFQLESEKANYYYNQLYKSLLVCEILHPPRLYS